MASVSSTISLIDNMSGALATIESNINSLKDSLKGVEDAGDSLNGANFSKYLASAEKAGKKIEKIGKQMSVALTTPLIMLGKEMYGDATEYEAAFAGMTKTVPGTIEQYKELNDIVLELSETTPSSYTDLMGIAQTGGNFDVPIENMESFLKSYSALQAATDQHINGEAGAESVAKFLNVTEGGVSGIERFSSAIVDLGNNYATTEDQILSMGNRMAAAAHLAGIGTPEILGMAAAFSSVGINEEAGGSAASKFIKQMQLASEVGGQAQDMLAAAGYDFGSALDFSYAIDSMKKSELVDMAESMGMTTEAVKSMADSWVLMDQFAEVSGKTKDQFVKDWSTSPVQAMSDFFTGLSQLGDKGGESILATLDKMGLTEIRESNLIAAMASRPELFASAIQTAVEAYGANTALWEEFAVQTGTQAAQNAMLRNKLQNTMANFGDNLVKALQPALDMVNNLLTAFNNLSETDQSNILKGLAVIAALGPALTIVGGAIKAIAAAMKLISGSGNAAANAVKGVVDAANGADVAGGAADAGLSVGSKIAGGVALAAVAYLFSKGAEYRAEHGAIGSIEAIQKATQDNEALRNAFVEWVAANNELNGMLDIPGLTDEQANSIAERQQKAIEAFQAIEGWKDVQRMYNDWRDTNGLSREDWLLPEDFLSLFQTPETPEVEIPQAETPQVEIPTPEVTVPETPQVEIPEPEIIVPDDVLPEIQIPVIPEYQVQGDTDLLRSQFAEFGITDPITVDCLINLGISPTDLNISDLTNEVTTQLQNTEEVTNAANNLGSAAVTAANQAMSPENFVVGLGFGLGVSQNIQSESASVSGASSAMSGGAVSAAEGILSAGAGAAIGRAFTAGLAGGISAGGAAVVAAASSVASAAKAAIASLLSIHSPSKVTYWQGQMTSLGFANGIRNGQANVLKTVGTLIDATQSKWNKGVWNLIGNFAETEVKALEDEYNHVKDGVKLDSTDIKRIRSLAEREVINHFTTPSFNIDMPTTVYAEKETDIDGIIDRLEDKITERLEACAEGVYN